MSGEQRHHPQGRGVLRVIMMVPVMIVVLLALVRPVIGADWHPPDSHSTLPHRAPASPQIVAVSVLSSPGLLDTGLFQPGRLTSDDGGQPGSISVEPPDYPPRARIAS